MNLAEEMGNLAGQPGGSGFENLELVYGGTVAEKDIGPLPYLPMKASWLLNGRCSV